MSRALLEAVVFLGFCFPKCFLWSRRFISFVFLTHRHRRLSPGNRAQWVVRRSRIHNSNTQVRDNHSVAPPCSHSPPSHAPVPKLMHFVTDAPEMGECSGPVTEISATVGSNITLPFKDATGDRVWRWERNNAELITCREGHPGFQGKTEDKGRFKVSCENHNLTIVGLQLGDQAQYSLCNSRHTCSCVNLTHSTEGPGTDQHNAPESGTTDSSKDWINYLVLAVGLTGVFSAFCLTLYTCTGPSPSPTPDRRLLGAEASASQPPPSGTPSLQTSTALSLFVVECEM
ncbi:hypothetical protein F2P81_018059 [Scophthalmus maximus]|uniref:Ig-like domain-containing protein n=1 Tax=Scophthalmus maximus TaxID=52904 RepID=A0A6A4SDH8_SCOMX|nr:hypothetical protein F2P81_018059 [Scophthalmus maximus]